MLLCFLFWAELESGTSGGWFSDFKAAPYLNVHLVEMYFQFYRGFVFSRKSIHIVFLVFVRFKCFIFLKHRWPSIILNSNVKCDLFRRVVF